VSSVKSRLEAIRGTGAEVSVITVRGMMLATIISSAPEILEKTFKDGSTFRASESFVRKWLHDTLDWSRRKGTQAAHKLPDNWEDQCEQSTFRKAYSIKEENIAAKLWVNSDQTQGVYAPGDKMTWAPKGSKQVPVHGAEEKRAFTLMVSVASDGTVLPMQAIYTGKTERSCPSPNAPHYADLINAGFLLEESGTTTYWSNHKTMHSFVNRILAPYFDNAKVELGLPHSQKSLWTIDVWSVHRSKEFMRWMRNNHPTIIVDFVPGGCTGVAQPCDVGIQRPLKLSMKKTYHEDIVSEVLQQIEAKSEVISIDSRVGTLRDRSMRWIWNAYKAINNKTLVKKVSASISE
jgi:DDE superfamily endonuclease